MRRTFMIWIVGIPCLLVLVAVGGLAVMSWTATRPANLGVVDGQLRDCGPQPNCVSSSASREFQRMTAIPYDGDPQAAFSLMAQIVEQSPRAKVVARQDDYLHAEFRSRLFRFVDDVEFVVDPANQEIQFRSASRVGHSDMGVNRARMNEISERFQQAMKNASATARGQSKGASTYRQADGGDTSPVSTFSIVAFDRENRAWGIGVASKFLAVGSVVPWAAAEQGAIATQSYANTTYGPRGLEMLADGLSATDVLAALTTADDNADERQVGIVDAQGRTATFTGDDCQSWAGGRTGDGYACQGNLLAGPQVLDAMCDSFEMSKGPLAWRIIEALEAAQAQGGDKRGRQSAAILVVKAGRGYAGFNDRMIDFRVDDHPEPIVELARILNLKVPRPVSLEEDQP